MFGPSQADISFHQQEDRVSVFPLTVEGSEFLYRDYLNLRRLTKTEGRAYECGLGHSILLLDEAMRRELVVQSVEEEGK